MNNGPTSSATTSPVHQPTLCDCCLRSGWRAPSAVVGNYLLVPGFVLSHVFRILSESCPSKGTQQTHTRPGRKNVFGFIFGLSNVTTGPPVPLKIDFFFRADIQTSSHRQRYPLFTASPQQNKMWRLSSLHDHSPSPTDAFALHTSTTPSSFASLLHAPLTPHVRSIARASPRFIQTHSRFILIVSSSGIHVSIS